MSDIFHRKCAETDARRSAPRISLLTDPFDIPFKRDAEEDTSMRTDAEMMEKIRKEVKKIHTQDISTKQPKTAERKI